MEPKPGYVCLGHVAVNAYSRLPDKNAYRCVKSHLVTRGISKMLWNSKGSPVKVRMSFWNVEPDPLEPMGLETGLFLLGSSINSPPVVTPFVIYSNMATTTETVPNADFSLSLYRTLDVKLVWNEKGTGADRQLSFWRPKTECCSLGDVAINNHYPSPAFYAKDIKNDSLAKPTNFERIYWNKNGKGGQVSIWRPVCPRGFVAIGHIANPNYNKPSVEDIRCVNSTLVTIGKWTHLWDSKATATDECRVYRADASNDSAVGLSVIGAVNSYGPMHTPAYVLKREKVKFNWGKRVSKIEITNIVYDFANKKTLSAQPTPISARTSVNNCAVSSGPDLEVQRQITYTTETESTWGLSVTVDVGVSVSFTAGVPMIADSTVSASVNIATTSSSEARKMESKQDTMSTTVSVPAGNVLSFYISGKNYRADIPWTGDLITTYQDGTTDTSKTSGVYKGSQISEVEVTREKPTPCSASLRNDSNA